MTTFYVTCMNNDDLTTTTSAGLAIREAMSMASRTGVGRILDAENCYALLVAVSTETGFLWVPLYCSGDHERGRLIESLLEARNTSADHANALIARPRPPKAAFAQACPSCPGTYYVLEGTPLRTLCSACGSPA